MPAREAISQPEAQALFAACDSLSYDPVYNWRWKLLYKGLWATGFRLGELLPVQPGDLRATGIVFTPLKTKGHPEHSQPREQPVHPDYLRELAAFLLANPVRRGRIWQYSDRRVRQVTHQLGIAAGITRAIHPHLFRYGYLHLMAESLRGDPQARPMLKELAHHFGRDDKFLDIYLRPTEREKRGAIDKVDFS